MRKHEGGKIQAARHIDERSGFVTIDFRGCSSQELSEIYQAFALLCVREEVRWALFRTGDEDADAHYALRDILVTVARIAGVPLQFRLALVVSSGPVEDVYADMQGELRALGCDSRVFHMEPEAGRWLRAASKRPARALAGEAAFVS